MAIGEWSPFDIHVMLHHHCSTDRFERKNAPIYPERRDALINAGLLEWRDGIPQSTPLGAALVAMWCSQPIPEVHYVDPRMLR
jgi:hypothetical protein